jgi:hypothetical protein
LALPLKSMNIINKKHNIVSKKECLILNFRIWKFQ